MKEDDWQNLWNKTGLYDRVLRRLLGASFTDNQADAIIDSIEDVFQTLEKFPTGT